MGNLKVQKEIEVLFNSKLYLALVNMELSFVDDSLKKYEEKHKKDFDLVVGRIFNN